MGPASLLAPLSPAVRRKFCYVALPDFAWAIGRYDALFEHPSALRRTPCIAMFVTSDPISDGFRSCDHPTSVLVIALALSAVLRACAFRDRQPVPCAVSAASGPVRRGLGCRSGCPKASFADRRLPSGGSVIAMVGCHSSCLPYPKIWPVPVISLPPERSSLGSPFAASAVRLAHSGGNLPHAFSDTAAGFAAASSGCNFSFDFKSFLSISPVRNALPMS